MADILTLNNAKIQMLNELKTSLSVVNDIDVDDGVKTFFLKGGYDANKTFDENKKSCIQYLSIKKAYNK